VCVGLQSVGRTLRAVSPVDHARVDGDVVEKHESGDESSEPQGSNQNLGRGCEHDLRCVDLADPLESGGYGEIQPGFLMGRDGSGRRVALMRE
jgi:hypothetical protein